MTNMILLTIGILLAGSTALMVSFYGGDAFFSSTKDAEASRLVVEGEQIVNAINVYIQRERSIPGAGGDSSAAFNDLIAKHYLSEIPRGAENSGWTVSYADKMIYSRIGSATDESSLEVCRAAQRQLNLPNPETVYKCDGSDHPAGGLTSREPCCIR